MRNPYTWETPVHVAWLETFREVARSGSLTAAAQTLGHAQPAVSRQIAALETATGARLFDRLPRGMRLTEEGRYLLAHAEVILERVHAARDDLEALRNLAAGRLRVGAIDSANTALVPRAMAAFAAAHPHVALSVAEGPTTEQLDRLRNGEVDVAVISRYPDQILDAGLLDLRQLMADPLMVALPAGHPLAKRKALRLAELAEEKWVEGHPATAQTLVNACQRAGFRARVDFDVRDWSAKLGFVAAGLGLTLVPTLSAPAARPDIVLRPLDPHDAPVREIHTATRRGNPAPSVATFLECLDAAASDTGSATPYRRGTGRRSTAPRPGRSPR
jgi:DNA-binding transcriptional LysR family regulator